MEVVSYLSQYDPILYIKKSFISIIHKTKYLTMLPSSKKMINKMGEARKFRIVLAGNELYL